MDPFTIVSLTAGCATLAGKTVESLKVIYDAHNSYKNAPDNLKFLLDDVRNAKEILDRFQLPTDADETLKLRSRESLEVFKHALDKVNTFAEKHECKVSKVKRLDRFLYAWNETEIKSLKTEVRSRIDNLKDLDWIYNAPPATSNATTRLDEPATEPMTPDYRFRYRLAGDRRAYLGGTYSEELISAADNGDAEGIRECLRNNADVNFLAMHDQHGCAAIHIVAKKGHLPALEALVEGNVDVNSVELQEEETALHIAARSGNSTMVRYLVSKNANFDARNRHQQTPLMVATEETVQIDLLKSGADPNIQDMDDNTALHSAIRLGHVNTVRELVRKGANVNALGADDCSPLRMAYLQREISEKMICEMIESMLLSSAAGKTISNAVRQELFYDAVRDNRSLVIRAILNTSADILTTARPDGFFPLHVVARDGTLSILNELLRHHASVHLCDRTTGRSPLRYAIDSGDLNKVKRILETAPDLRLSDSSGYAPIHTAFDRSSIDVAELIVNAHLATGVSLYLQNKSGRFPIHLACGQEKVDLWAKSIDGPINPVYDYTQAGRRGRHSILHFSVLDQCAPTVEAIIKHNANLKELCDSSFTPTEELCANEPAWTEQRGEYAFQERLEVLKILIEHGQFTEKCRDLVSKWKDEKLKAALNKELPQRTYTNTARVGAEYVGKAVLGGMFLIAAMAEGQKKAQGQKK
ncbi:uncharacterized protein J4E88_008614 [Alternaria novae-zelandiae]|uniref:uncharacterized protein n=1 Tax=Alternaria novae-zelandiae TaxID=430562 RepID=UPI0020C3A18A|nr:uncharacterized protein J4E88_008614 [Alternaria novae-zelandiae]KAI4673559.1 hypothetical protein J4E88_008614 [Alternaria novae-zelandiae]